IRDRNVTGVQTCALPILRIGAATAKGLGLALDKPIVAVPTVDALAYNLYDTDKLICPMMDARRQQVYTGIYAFENHRLKVLREQIGRASCRERVYRSGGW